MSCINFLKKDLYSTTYSLSRNLQRFFRRKKCIFNCWRTIFYRSLRTNLPYLFTYKNYKNLSISNTTNALEDSLGKCYKGKSKQEFLSFIEFSKLDTPYSKVHSSIIKAMDIVGKDSIKESEKIIELFDLMDDLLKK